MKEKEYSKNESKERQNIISKEIKTIHERLSNLDQDYSILAPEVSLNLIKI